MGFVDVVSLPGPELAVALLLVLLYVGGSVLPAAHVAHEHLVVAAVAPCHRGGPLGPGGGGGFGGGGTAAEAARVCLHVLLLVAPEGLRGQEDLEDMKGANAKDLS